jgi:CheY-like chemotaxis protein
VSGGVAVKTLLVVDDEFSLLQVMDAILTDSGFRVIAAINGRVALEQLANAKPDLVLLDYMMPVLDGPSVLRAMAAAAAWRDIPVVMMSSLPEAAVAEQCHGYAAFLRKPFSAAKVIETIRRILGE